MGAHYSLITPGDAPEVAGEARTVRLLPLEFCTTEHFEEATR